MVKFRNIVNSDIESLATVHLSAFQGFFLSTLGREFLNTYYRSCLSNPKTIGICAVNEDHMVIGFCFGTSLSKGFHKEVVKNNFMSFFRQVLKILFKNPLAIYRLLKNMSKNMKDRNDGNYAELLSIAVSPNLSGTGIGKELILEFEQRALRMGCQKITLTTDFYNNSKVLDFYNRRGYKILYDFVAYPNRKMYKLIKDINL